MIVLILILYIINLSPPRVTCKWMCRTNRFSFGHYKSIFLTNFYILDLNRTASYLRWCIFLFWKIPSSWVIRITKSTVKVPAFQVFFYLCIHSSNNLCLSIYICPSTCVWIYKKYSITNNIYSKKNIFELFGKFLKTVKVAIYWK